MKDRLVLGSSCLSGDRGLKQLDEMLQSGVEPFALMIQILVGHGDVGMAERKFLEDAERKLALYRDAGQQADAETESDALLDRFEAAELMMDPILDPVPRQQRLEGGTVDTALLGGDVREVLEAGQPALRVLEDGVAGFRYEHKRLLSQDGGMKAVFAYRLAEEQSDIQVAVSNLRDDAFFDNRPNLNGDVRIGAPELLDDRGEEIGDHGLNGADDEAALHLSGYELLGAVVQGENFHETVEQLLSRGGELHMPAVALEQAGVVLQLQLLDLLRDAGLGIAQLLRGLGEAVASCHLDKRAQIIELHPDTAVSIGVLLLRRSAERRKHVRGEGQQAAEPAPALRACLGRKQLPVQHGADFHFLLFR